MKSDRLKKDPESRNTLIELEDANVIRREKVGIRNVIQAATNMVVRIGFDLDELHGSTWKSPALPNFCPAVPFATGWVGYEGGRAYLTATQARSGWEGHILDVSTHFPLNRLAYDLLHQPCTKNSSFGKGVPIHGDAILVTDTRAHWVFSRNISDEDFENLNLLLTTPRDVLTRSNGRKWIFFHEEPNALDIVMMKLRWIG